jgi:segregation and condensation protein B
MDPFPEHLLRLAEALIFASAEPVTPATLADRLGPEIDVHRLADVLIDRHAGKGFELVASSGGWHFRTAPELAEALQLTQDREQRIPRVAMEVLVLIAYEQPIARAEIEACRSAALSQKTLDLLLELNLIRSIGRRPAPGRPILWATTHHFLSTFGLTALSDLPGSWRPLRAAP